MKKLNTSLVLVPTGVKANLETNQVLELSIRSSIPMSSYLSLGNSTGIIDADYYNNPSNEGHIFFQIINLSPCDILLKKGDIIGQGVIYQYCTTDDDQSNTERSGGLGSTTIS